MLREWLGGVFAMSNSRRRFLVQLGSVAVAGMAGPSAWAVEKADARTAAVVAETIGIDTHNHVDVPLTAAEMPGPEIDLAGEMKRSGLSAICMTFATDYQPGDPYQRFRSGLAAMDRQLKRNGLKRALSAAEIRASHGRGEPAVVQAVEGGHFLEGRIERVEEAYGLGLRHFGLLHDSDASVPLGDVYTNAPKYGGLTEFGAAVIKECERLRILVDLTHASMATTEGALKVATRPMVISHTGLDTQLGSDASMARMMRPRLISKEQAKAVADKGGLVGVWTHLSETPMEYARNVRKMVDVIGVEHVCLGTDTKLTPPGGRPGGPPGSPPPGGPRVGERTNLAWAGQTEGFYYVVVDAMLRTGFTVEEIGKVGGGNYLRVFGEAVG